MASLIPEGNTVREQRQATMGSDERSLEERRKVQKLIRDADELHIPKLVGYLVSYLEAARSGVQASKRLLPAATTAAVGLADLASIGSTDLYTCHFGQEMTIEALLIYALEKSQNQMQCAAAEALGTMGTLAAQQPLLKAAGSADHPGDKSPIVRAYAAIALRKVDMRLGGRDLSAARSIKTLTPVELDSIFHQACDQEPDLELAQPKDNLYRVTVTLPGDVRETAANRVDRTQRVFIQTNNQHTKSYGKGVTINADYVVLYTMCGPVNEANCRQVLKMNALRLKPENLQNQPYGFSQGSLGIDKTEFIMIDTQPTENVTRESIYNGIRVLANLGDEIEKKLTGGKDRSEDEVEERL